MKWTLYQALIIAIFVSMGMTGNVMVKFANLQESVGIDGETRLYHHPFIQNNMGLLGMLLNLPIFKIVFYYIKRKDEALLDEHVLTRGNRNFNVAILLLPSCLDIVGTSCMLVALVLTHVSSLAMLRSSIIIFTAILSYFAFKYIPNCRECFGLLLVTAGLVLIGLADYLDKKQTEKAEDDDKEIWSVILGDCLAIGGSFLAACQVVLEEKYLKSRDIPPLQAVGWEGVFGFTIMAILQIPLYFIPIMPPLGDNSRGTMEDVPDGFVQIYNCHILTICTIFDVIIVALYNFCGLTVSKELSSTTRLVVDSLKIIPIWIISILAFGQTFQYVQLIGFLVLLTGQGFYNNLGCTAMRRKMCPRESDLIEENEQPTNKEDKKH